MFSYFVVTVSVSLLVSLSVSRTINFSSSRNTYENYNNFQDYANSLMNLFSPLHEGPANYAKEWESFGESNTQSNTATISSQNQGNGLTVNFGSNNLNEKIHNSLQNTD